jgi:hypothetical protein
LGEPVAHSQPVLQVVVVPAPAIHVGASPGRAAEPALVVGLDGVAGLGELAADVVVPAGVLGQAVDDHKLSDDHDGRYYTETEIDAKLAAKVDPAYVDDKIALIQQGQVADGAVSTDRLKIFQ